MIDLHKRQEEFERNLLFKVGKVPSEIFDAFRKSPEYLMMKAALEFYANPINWTGAEYAPMMKDTDGVVTSDFGRHSMGAKAREVLNAIEGV